MEFSPGEWSKDAQPLRYVAVRFVGKQLDLDGKVPIKHLTVVTNRRDLDAANLAFLLPFFGESGRNLGIAGRATVAVVINGTLSDPELPRAIVILDRFGLPGWTPVPSDGIARLSLRGRDRTCT